MPNITEVLMMVTELLAELENENETETNPIAAWAITDINYDNDTNLVFKTLLEKDTNHKATYIDNWDIDSSFRDLFALSKFDTLDLHTTIVIADTFPIETDYFIS